MITQEVSQQPFIQSCRVPEKTRHTLRIKVFRQKAYSLQELESFLRIPVEMISTYHQPPFDILLLPDELNPTCGILVAWALQCPERNEIWGISVVHHLQLRGNWQGIYPVCHAVNHSKKAFQGQDMHG
ncbi:hypothetical protein Mapa_007190 [Marchantia paleacea]|nr:hypothetical protein Mapa_007190 [Marchantia paleacea]